MATCEGKCGAVLSWPAYRIDLFLGRTTSARMYYQNLAEVMTCPR